MYHTRIMACIVVVAVQRWWLEEGSFSGGGGAMSTPVVTCVQDRVLIDLHLQSGLFVP